MIAEQSKENEFLRNRQFDFLPFPTPIKDGLKIFLENKLIEHSIVCYHCTRLNNKDDVISNGLKVLNVDSYRKEIIRNLEPYISQNWVDIADECLRNYNDSGAIGKREGMIWFIGNLNLIKDGGCNDLFRYYGGEITRRVLENHNNIFYPILESIGTPYIIKCEIPLKELKTDYHYEILIEQIIQSLIDERYIDFEFYITKDISPNMIKDVIPFPDYNYSNIYP